MIDYKYEALKWFSSEYDKSKDKRRFKKRFIGSRGYPHFDVTINLYDAEQKGKLEYCIASEETLLSWQFFPFVRNDQRSRRYRHKPKVLSPLKHRNQKLYTHIKSRPIMYASHMDACLFSFMNFILSKPYEEELSKHKLANSVIAYRSIKKSNNITFAKKAFDYINAKDSFACLLIDIKSFFETIPHEELINSITSILGQEIDEPMTYVLTNLLKYRYVIEDEVIKEMKKNKRPYYVSIGKKAKRLCKIEDYNKLVDGAKLIRKNTKARGFPQGSPVSGLLANIYLLEFDDWLSKRLAKYKVHLYQRYSDDMLIVCPESEVTQLYSEIKSKLKTLGLSLSTGKTELFISSEGNVTNQLSLIEPKKVSSRRSMQYLGLEWDGKQIVLRPSTVAKRLRPKNKLSKKYWLYHRAAIRHIGQQGIEKQFIRIRRSIKKKKSSTDT